MKKLITLRIDEDLLEEIQQLDSVTGFLTKAAISRLKWIKGSRSYYQKKEVQEKEKETDYLTDEDIIDYCRNMMNLFPEKAAEYEKEIKEIQAKNRKI